MPQFLPPDQQLRFGIFLPPMHKTGVNPTLAIQRDLELIDHLDRLGYHEAWIGEHHSAGSELIASPEVFIAASAQRTTNIRLGTGVNSLPYHHPLILADRIVQLDHMTKGRMMFGAGPGQLTSDAAMLGIDPNDQRPRMQEAFDVIMRLFAGETVTSRTDWYTVDEGVLQMRPYSNFDVAVVSSVSPSGSKLAGRYGAGLTSIAATEPAGFGVLDYNFNVWQEEAKLHGHTADRSDWRLMGPMHIAATEDEARENCKYGLQWVFSYLAHILPMGDPNDPPPPEDYDEFVDFLNESGRMVIGTPEMAIAQIERLQEKTGGFGCYMMMGADFADWRATKESYELFAYEVMPHFTGQIEPVQTSYDKIVDAGSRWADATLGAQLTEIGKYEEERAARPD
ncbi:LLM class flavin-dependent oxidoreductase [Ilumatobacter coccineus]|uniref:Limonene 1,2-monooxygenase n=1 Tax=Ilumatobacter coccineus (strain NBRC 103263 / KCTC 29153 / YM16-304) TaxID=1313172 RepID=A0A6C7E8V0_ILUCY|nr:LLM class flavin-dependent oxidoreductase [Ilumatobacter coccineus]BAN02891.1 limonene 1,2-monooxygenase [Ilumatobacter coccineus YM16-304]